MTHRHAFLKKTIAQTSEPLKPDDSPKDPVLKKEATNLASGNLTPPVTGKTAKSLQSDESPTNAAVLGEAVETLTPPQSTESITTPVRIKEIKDFPPTTTSPVIAKKQAPLQLDKSDGVSVLKKEKMDSVATSPPLILGQLIAHEDEIISWMVVKIYGIFKRELLDIVIKSNSHIIDPDHAEGNVISFPAIPSFVDHMKPNYYWIHLDTKDSLKEAFDVFRSFPKSYPNHAPRYGLIPYWNSKDGLKFAIIYKFCFLDEQSARNRMNTLPQSPFTQRKVISSWNKGNIYYADPYTCRNLARPILNKG